MRPRYGRLAVLGAALSVTGIAMLGGIGVLPSVANPSHHPTGHSAGPALAAADTSPSTQASTTPSTAPTTPPAPSSSQAGGAGKGSTQGTSDAPQDDQADADSAALDPPAPADSGDGKRVVFDQSDQRVWLVDDSDHVVKTYLVSGSLTGNLDRTYAVYSKSEDAVGVDDSGTMKYFVRFTQGPTGAAIGFHDIPIDNGRLVQTAAQLGTPQSHGCIRQLRPDAIELWDFAPVGTEVDVTA